MKARGLESGQRAPKKDRGFSFASLADAFSSRRRRANAARAEQNTAAAVEAARLAGEAETRAAVATITALSEVVIAEASRRGFDRGATLVTAAFDHGLVDPELPVAGQPHRHRTGAEVLEKAGKKVQEELGADDRTFDDRPQGRSSGFQDKRYV